MNKYKNIILKREIKGIMLRYNLDTKKMRSNVNKGIEYEITNFLRTHGQEYHQME